MLNLLDLGPDQLTECVRSLGYPDYRAGQLRKWLYSDIRGFGDMTDLPSALREHLEAEAWRGVPEAAREQKDADGSVKALWAYPGGDKAESVLMRYKHGVSACLSTQVGCKMGCAFCASARGGFVRDLTGGEIMGQYLGMRMLAGERVGRVVLMGTGEPLDNFDNVLFFLKSLRDGAGISMRHVSVSTCGLPDGIIRLARSGFPVTLSVSLHAPDDLTRSGLMPVGKRHPISEVLAACGEYFRVTGRRVSYEYILIDGVNDGGSQARALARLLRGGPAHVNLITCNPVDGAAFAPSARADTFKKLLEREGVTVTARRRLGLGIDAACGQLRRSDI